MAALMNEETGGSSDNDVQSNAILPVPSQLVAAVTEQVPQPLSKRRKRQ